MAKPGQNQQETSADDGCSSKKAGGRQAVVELCGISTCGLTFWSRSRFDIGAEVQVRIHRSALPASWLVHVPCGTWILLQGLVAACPPLRREDGSSGFEVSLLIEKDAHDAIRPVKVRSQMNWSSPPMPGLRRFGLN